MSLVDSLDAKLFARKDKQFEQNMQMENLKLKSVIAANDAKFKEGQLANQQAQIVGNQQYRNALVNVQQANLALNQRKQAFDEDERLAFRDPQLANLQARTDLTQAQTGGQMARTDATRLNTKFAQDSYDTRLDNLSLTGELQKSQIKAQDLTNQLNTATMQDKINMSGLGVEGAKLDIAGKDIQNQMNQNILNYQPQMQEQRYQAGQVGIDATKQSIEASKAQMENDQAKLNLENKKFGLAQNKHTFQKQQYEDMMKKLPNEARFMGNYTNNMNPVTNALLANVNTKGNNVKSYAKTFLGYAFASPSLVQSGKADREIINSIKKTKYNDISKMLGNLNTMLGSGNANIDQINDAQIGDKIIINAKANAKAKLIAGQPLTEEEADTIVL